MTEIILTHMFSGEFIEISTFSGMVILITKNAIIKDFLDDRKRRTDTSSTTPFSF